MRATRYSSLDQINTSNVKQLQVAWTFSTGVLRGHEGGPLVIGDVMYIHAPFPNTVFALDLNNDGRILWKYQPTQDPNVIPVMCCDTVNRGVAYADGKIFLHQADTTLVALDAKTRQGGLERQGRRSRPRARPALRRRSWSRTWSSSATAAASSAFAAMSRPMTSAAASRSGVPIPWARTRHADGSATRRRRWASRSARTPVFPPGRVTSGRSAAARPGAGSPMIRS